MTDEDLIADHVAACPVTPLLMEQIVGLAELPWDDPTVLEAATRRLGWCEGDGLPLEDTLVTAEGHLAYLGDDLALSFAHFYWVGGEDWGEDFWGTLPGWSSHENAGREVFDAQIDAAIAGFTQRLGPPERDLRSEGGTLAMGPGHWRHAAWRRGNNLLVIGPRHEGLSYFQFEEAVIYIGSVETTAPPPALHDFIA
ncbi:hypothetical protein STRCI_008384 [Streptomyces cinnabarinus]|uniref:SMI1/KNR4 family protein n=1 Tax=Streptomyces cinnabarinus TaxID=67287 RepID=A0ABY7KRW5_9ACTN|nr:hypothetical protein [Streptomyces cinnabarinus]WAZ26753.1 hypothetical protein STRCI_008384 [Streptomyces cinnabarinus]